MADGNETAQPGDIEELLGGLSPSTPGAGAVVKGYYDSSSDDDGSLEQSLRTPGSGDSSVYSPESENAQGLPVPTSEEMAEWDKMGYDGAASPVSDGGGGAGAAMTPPPAPADFEEAALTQRKFEFLAIEHEAAVAKLAAANKTIEGLMKELQKSERDNGGQSERQALEKKLEVQVNYTKELQRRLGSAEKRNTALSRKAEPRSNAGKRLPKLGESLRW